MPQPSTRSKAAQGGSIGNVSSYSSSPRTTLLNQQLDGKIAAMETQLTKQITDAIVGQINTIISSEVSKSIDQIKLMFSTQLADMQQEIDQLKEQHAASIDTFTKELSFIKNKISQQENSVVATELRLHGVPFIENEDLTHLVKTLCESLEITVPDIDNVKRLKGNPNRPTNTDAPIIIKLKTPQAKNKFLFDVADFKQKNNKTHLLLNQMGFESDAKIYINEQLTKQNHNILKSAVRLKKQNRLWSVYTRRGMIYVKRQRNDNAVCVRNIDQLDKIKTKNHLSANQNNEIRETEEENEMQNNNVSCVNQSGFRGFEQSASL